MHFFSMRLKTLFLLAVLVNNGAASAIHAGKIVFTSDISTLLMLRFKGSGNHAA